MNVTVTLVKGLLGTDVLLSIIPFHSVLFGMSPACHDLPSGNSFCAHRLCCQESLLVCPSAFRPTVTNSCLPESADIADFCVDQKIQPLMCKALESSSGSSFCHRYTYDSLVCSDAH